MLVLFSVINLYLNPTPKSAETLKIIFSNHINIILTYYCRENILVVLTIKNK